LREGATDGRKGRVGGATRKRKWCKASKLRNGMIRISAKANRKETRVRPAGTQEGSKGEDTGRLGGKGTPDGERVTR